jgi:hypothetical protein
LATDIDVSQKHRERETKTFVTASIVAILGFVFGTISRAPTILAGFSKFGIDLAINVGHIVVFGPLVLLVGIVWVRILIERVREDSELLRPIGSRVLRGKGIGLGPFMLPGLAMLFLWVQFVQEFAPPEKTTPTSIGSCDTFEPWKQMLFDWKLETTKYRYCFGGIDDQQEHMPEIFPPYQTWVWLAVALLGTWLCTQNWWRWTAAQRTRQVRRRREKKKQR